LPSKCWKLTAPLRRDATPKATPICDGETYGNRSPQIFSFLSILSLGDCVCIQLFQFLNGPFWCSIIAPKAFASVALDEVWVAWMETAQLLRFSTVQPAHLHCTHIGRIAIAFSSGPNSSFHKRSISVGSVNFGEKSGD